MSDRITARFNALKAEKRAAFVTFITAGDPDPDTSAKLLARLPEAGADIIELGMPFTDPMADGPAIQEASLRALHAGMTMHKVLEMVANFRKSDTDTPIILMGYFNPIMAFGVEAFVEKASSGGVDGLIVVDLPPEEDAELRVPAAKAGIAMIRLATPTTDDARLPRVLDGASGFLYYVSVAGVTGTSSAQDSDIEAAVTRIHAASDLPVAVGFGIKSPKDVARIGQLADAAVVGSAIVAQIKANLDETGQARPGLVDAVSAFVHTLAEGTRG
ncbi:tryptophan synthase alpha chain [Iodidimonas gelatinilytica]|uniref:Tryptophan synthase alpha chain n=1 Tax=Iodidimonas gelatinilytica TaxID=1236966 RepID=A0A5A7MPU6_9PROT|nr:tryptophan synthase subunit alpha [Iodidimonas gelatinilytica]GEQ97005.1 tryptophan synthase alpha chain [Iodidimonas gelatinilytica]